MRIDAGLDTGDMLLKAETEIGPEENAVELGRAPGGDGRGSAGARRWRGWRPAASCREKQDTAQATYAPLLKKEDGAHRLEPAGAGDPQPGARAAAVAGRVHRFPRADAARLAIARWRGAALGRYAGSGA